MTTNEKLDRETEDLFENARPIDELDLKGFGEQVRALLDDPDFKAGLIKDQFIHHVHAGMGEEGITASELARRWGKSRQYLSKLLNEDQRVNYTVDTMVEVMHHLGRKVDVRFLRADEETVVVRKPKSAPLRQRPRTGERARPRPAGRFEPQEAAVVIDFSKVSSDELSAA